MNSPLKYRGYLPRTMKPVYGCVIERRCRKFYIYTADHQYIRVSSRHLCLFTGVLDVRGNELYEEDYVYRDGDPRKYQIQYHHAGFCLVSKTLSMRLPITDGMRLIKMMEDEHART